MSTNKIFTLEEAVALTYDDETIYYYPMTEREAFMIRGQAEFVGWQTRWREQTFLQDYLNKKVASIVDGLMNPLGCDTMTCLDVENCLNTSELINAINTVTYQNTTTIQNQVNQQRWEAYQVANDILDINPNAPAIYSDNSQQNINELCTAVDHFVNDFRARMIDASENVISGGIVIASYGTFIAGVSAFFNPLVSLIGGVIVYLGTLTAIEAQEVKTAFEDMPAIEGIICQLLELLHTTETTYDNYIAALAEIDGTQTPNSSQETIAYWLNLYCANEEIFAYFVDILGTVQNGSFDNCACLVPVQCGGALAYIPATQGYLLNPLDPSIYLIGYANMIFTGGFNCIEMGIGNSGGEFEIFTNAYHCIQRFNFYWMKSGAGTGNPVLRIYVDDILKSTVVLTQPAGAWFGANPAWTSVVGQKIRVTYDDPTTTKNLFIRPVSIAINDL